LMMLCSQGPQANRKDENAFSFSYFLSSLCKARV